MKQLTVITKKIGAGKQSGTASSTINTMQVYFQNDKRKMGNLEQAITNSVKRFIEKEPPNDAA